MFIVILLLILLLVLYYYFYQKESFIGSTSLEKDDEKILESDVEKLEKQLQHIVSRIPYFCIGTVRSGKETDLQLRGNSLNKIMLDFTLQEAPRGSQGPKGITGKRGETGEKGMDGKQGLKGYEYWQ